MLADRACYPDRDALMAEPLFFEDGWDVDEHMIAGIEEVEEYGYLSRSAADAGGHAGGNSRVFNFQKSDFDLEPSGAPQSPREFLDLQPGLF